jgi:hypothetical protein
MEHAATEVDDREERFPHARLTRPKRIWLHHHDRHRHRLALQARPNYRPLHRFQIRGHRPLRPPNLRLHRAEVGPHRTRHTSRHPRRFLMCIQRKTRLGADERGQRDAEVAGPVGITDAAVAIARRARGIPSRKSTMDLSVPHISHARLCASFSNVHTGQAHGRSFGAPDMSAANKLNDISLESLTRVTCSKMRLFSGSDREGGGGPEPDDTRGGAVGPAPRAAYVRN